MAKFKVKASSTVPVGSADWKVDLGEDPVEAMAYTNLAYALIARCMAQLGWAMSQAILGNTAKLDELKKSVDMD